MGISHFLPLRQCLLFLATYAYNMKGFLNVVRQPLYLWLRLMTKAERMPLVTGWGSHSSVLLQCTKSRSSWFLIWVHNGITWGASPQPNQLYPNFCGWCPGIRILKYVLEVVVICSQVCRIPKLWNPSLWKHESRIFSQALDIERGIRKETVSDFVDMKCWVNCSPRWRFYGVQ